MNILLIGGTGFISGSLAQRLLDRDDRITILTRGKSKNNPGESVDRIVADRTVPTELERALQGRRFDVVYDMVAYRPEESATIARILRGRLGRFIHCSTVSVYMVSEQIRTPVTEDQDKAPLMPFWDRNPFGMGYGILKRRCEEVLWKAHDPLDFPVTMLRPTFVSGPKDPTGRDFFWIERILDDGPLLVPGSGDFPFQQVFVDDVARAFAGLLDCPRTVGKAYNVAGEETFTLNEYLHALGSLLGRDPELVHVDQAAFDSLPFSSSPAGDVFPFNTRRPALFSLDAIKRDTGYHSTPFDVWMKETIEWWVSAPRGHSNGYEQRAEELEYVRSRVG